MTLKEKDVGKLVLIGMSVTVIVKVIARLYVVLSTQESRFFISTVIGGILAALILWALWAGKKWARYLLGYSHFLGGALTGILTIILTFEGKADDFISIPVCIWYVIIGALLIWGPGVRSYMHERRQVP